MAARPVVVVEDDEAIRENLQEFLESEGYRVRTASNGKEGLAVIRELKGSCLVLLDLQMPVMTGEQLLDALQQEGDPAIRATPVLVLTARTEGLSRPDIVGLIRKPIDLDPLLAQVETYCQRE